MSAPRSRGPPTTVGAMSSTEEPSETGVDIKPRSRDVTDGIQKAASRAMLRAVGLGEDDWDKPQVGIASVMGRYYVGAPMGQAQRATTSWGSINPP